MKYPITILQAPKLPSSQAPKPLPLRRWLLIIGLPLFLLGSLDICRAEAPEAPTPCPSATPPPWPNRTPPIEQIPAAYRPPPTEGHTLEWRRYTPSGNGPWPTVVLLHAGHFASGSPFGMTLERVAEDLKNAGYYVLVPSWRLAPCGLIPGQYPHDITDAGLASGRPPQQSNDVKAIIQAARDDVNCLNDKVGVVGGSAGATHAVWMALDTNPTVPSTDWPFWTATDRADVAVCLSGAYLFSDRTTELYNPIMDFEGLIVNYTGTKNLVKQADLSPTKLVQSPSQFPFKPIFLINSQFDTMPYHQIVRMQDALEAKGIFQPTFKLITIPNNSAHSYEYWYDNDGQPVPHTIKEDVIDYLDTYLKP